MLIVLVVLAIMLHFVIKIGLDKDIALLEWLGIAGMATLILTIFIALGMIIITYDSGYTATDKIKMYEEENTKIETNIDVLVKQYMNFESETYKEFKSESAITLVSVFPELKSDKLVEEQIEIYQENNKKIKEFKEELIDMKIAKWLLYFGK